MYLETNLFTIKYGIGMSTIATNKFYKFASNFICFSVCLSLAGKLLYLFQ